MGKAAQGCGISTTLREAGSSAMVREVLEVEQHLVELRGVAQDGPEVLRVIGLQLDVLREAARDQFLHLLSSYLFAFFFLVCTPNKKRLKRKTGLNKVWADGNSANVVGLLVRKLRRQRGLTQEQLSAQCQVRGLELTRSTLAKIGARLRFIKACDLFIIAKVLKVPMEHFYPPGFGSRRSR